MSDYAVVVKVSRTPTRCSRQPRVQWWASLIALEFLPDGATALTGNYGIHFCPLFSVIAWMTEFVRCRGAHLFLTRPISSLRAAFRIDPVQPCGHATCVAELFATCWTK
ncbi:MAG: hypothetical protein VR74_02165 [Hyphomonas sp. BRH_c22]|nr:MAG: hypothetical protein VR74_02165 [Hyphomonas sp. BRH_c22]